MATLFGLQFIITLLAHSRTMWNGVSLVCAGLGFGLTLAAIANARFRNLAVADRITFSDSGMSGTIDGVAAAIRWAAIACGRDLDDAFVNVRRNGRVATAIPKRSISDPGAFRGAILRIGKCPSAVSFVRDLRATR